MAVSRANASGLDGLLDSIHDPSDLLLHIPPLRLQKPEAQQAMTASSESQNLGGEPREVERKNIELSCFEYQSQSYVSSQQALAQNV